MSLLSFVCVPQTDTSLPNLADHSTHTTVGLLSRLLVRRPTVRLELVMPNTHRQRDSTVELRRVGGVNTIRKFATSTRRLPTDSVDNLEIDHNPQ